MLKAQQVIFHAYSGLEQGQQYIKTRHKWGMAETTGATTLDCHWIMVENVFWSGI